MSIMEEAELKTMKEVADHFHRPAHRIIHLCETGVVKPAVNATGRGSVRRFNRDNTFHILLALKLQEAGVEVPLIKPLMKALANLMRIPEVKNFAKKLGQDDLVEVLRRLGAADRPVLTFLTPPDRVALVTPEFSVPNRPDVRVDLHMSDRDLLRRGVSIVANLTDIADYIANTLWGKS